jgi:hypothetical protein
MPKMQMPPDAASAVNVELVRPLMKKLVQFAAARRRNLVQCDSARTRNAQHVKRRSASGKSVAPAVPRRKLAAKKRRLGCARKNASGKSVVNADVANENVYVLLRRQLPPCDPRPTVVVHTLRHPLMLLARPRMKKPDALAVKSVVCVAPWPRSLHPPPQIRTVSVAAHLVALQSTTPQRHLSRLCVPKAATRPPHG